MTQKKEELQKSRETANHMLKEKRSLENQLRQQRLRQIESLQNLESEHEGNLVALHDKYQCILPNSRVFELQKEKTELEKLIHQKKHPKPHKKPIRTKKRKKSSKFCLS